MAASGTSMISLLSLVVVNGVSQIEGAQNITAGAGQNVQIRSAIVFAMNPITRNALAVVLGLVIGGVVNMSLIMLGPLLIPPPDGVDVTSVDSIAASIHLFEPRHFVFPFLAHAMGTFVGALVTYLTATRYAFTLAVVIGVLFLFGGVINSLAIPAPTWFVVLDIVAAYIPMSVLAILAGRKIKA